MQYNHRFGTLLLAFFDFLAFVITAFFLYFENANLYCFYVFLGICFVGVVLARVQGQYTIRIPFGDNVVRTLRWLVLMAAIHGVAVLFFMPELKWRWAFGWGALMLVMPVFRIFVRSSLIRVGLWRRPVIVLGSEARALRVAQALSDERLLGFKISAIVDLFGTDTNVPKSAICLAGENVSVIGPRDFYRCFESLKAPHLVVALGGDEPVEAKNFVEDLMVSFPDINVLPALPGFSLLDAEAYHFLNHDLLMLRVRNNLNKKGYILLKRIVDLVLASFGIVILSPLFLWVAFLIWREDGGPVVFCQERLGLGGKKFKFYKFRSMTKDADAVLTRWKETGDPLWVQYQESNFKLANDPRVLKIGRFIRSTSIDELPQLWNVIRGDMSLVGPRPLLERELSEYGRYFGRYYSRVLPGMTGLWQVSGRSSTRFSDRVLYDSWYVKNWNFLYDFSIIFKTVFVVLSKNGAA